MASRPTATHRAMIRRGLEGEVPMSVYQCLIMPGVMPTVAKQPIEPARAATLW